MKNAAGKELPFSLERTVLIRARRETVFGFFTDSVKFSQWWGPGSEIEPHRGGRVSIRYPNQVAASGEVLEIDPVERIVFSYGYESGSPIAPGGSTVTITLEQLREGTRVRLRHDIADAPTRDHHVQGWRYQMAVFANVVSSEEHAHVNERADKFLAAWGEPDAAVQAQLLGESVIPEIIFRDKFSATEGLEDLKLHLAAAVKHMPGVRVRREGEVSQCQGTAVIRWVVIGPNAAEIGRGMNICDLAPDGRFARVVGFWGG